MKVVLVRVGIDSGKKSGEWNAPINSNNEFAYVPIRETEGGIKPLRPGYETNYEQFRKACEKFGKENELPPRFDVYHSHLDPDFRYLTYGDSGGKGKQLENLKLHENDIIAFYAGLKPSRTGIGKVVDALIGIYFLADKPIKALEISGTDWKKNAHTRREPKQDDIVLLGKNIVGKPNISGKLDRCIRIGGYDSIKGSYYLDNEIQREWGEPKPFYLFGFHRELCHPEKFLEWFNRYLEEHNINLVQSNY